MGRRRSARRRQPDHAGQGARGEEHDHEAARSISSATSTRSGMPMFGTRHFSLRIPQAFGPPGSNQTIYHDEIVSGELGQIGTQFDGLGHLGIGDLFYNGNNRSEFAQGRGADQARRRERRRHRDARRADRRRGLQGRRRSSPAATRSRVADLKGALQAGGRADPFRRHRPAPHRLGIALDEGQREVRRERAGHRPGRRAVPGRAGGRDGRRGHVGVEVVPNPDRTLRLPCISCSWRATASTSSRT